MEEFKMINISEEVYKMSLRNTSLGKLTKLFLANNPSLESKTSFYIEVKKPAFSASRFLEIFGLIGGFSSIFSKNIEKGEVA
jgi:hypothetical protein